MSAWPQPAYVPLDQAGGSSNVADLNRTPHSALTPPRNLGVNSVVVESSIQPGQEAEALSGGLLSRLATISLSHDFLCQVGDVF